MEREEGVDSDGAYSLSSRPGPVTSDVDRSELSPEMLGVRESGGGEASTTSLSVWLAGERGSVGGEVGVPGGGVMGSVRGP